MLERSDATSNFLLESWLEFHEAIEQHPEIRHLLFDPVTGLPTTPLLFPRIRMLLEERGEVTLLCVNVVRYSRIEEIYGWKAFDEVMRCVAHALEQIAGTTLRDSDIVAELMISGNAFVIVLSPPRESDHIDPSGREAVVRKVEAGIHEFLGTCIEPPLFRKFGCYVGASTIIYDTNTRLERLVHEGLEEALTQSHSREAHDAMERVSRLREIIDAGQVSTLVQPIFDLSDMSVIGYEALTRGPMGSEFERPDKLFRIAYDADLVLRLERLCRKRALEAARDLPEGRLLFMNIEPDAVADPQLREITTTAILTEVGLTPERIVLEITERTAITDFGTFRSTLEYVRALGFAVAVDDAGAGYGSLQCLAEVHPEWLKIDLSLVRGVDVDEVRTELIHSLVTFARTLGVKLIAEGIETPEELERLRTLGVQYGQGFLLSVPVTPYPDDASLPGIRL